MKKNAKKKKLIPRNRRNKYAKEIRKMLKNKGRKISARIINHT